MKTPFSENLKTARQLEGWHQYTAAMMLDIPIKNLGAYEQGRAQPSIELFIKICEVYKIEKPFLFFRQKDYFLSPISEEKKENNIEAKYHSLRGKDKDIVDILLK